jgi:hypothetical protein
MAEPLPSAVGSIDAVVAALYTSISGPAGQARDWGRLRALFYPGARLLRTTVSAEGKVEMAAMDLEGFIARASPCFEAGGFFEREVARRVDRFGHIAQVFSTYAASAEPDGREPLGRGINSIQLWSDGGRWWVMSLLWDDERPGHPIPPHLLTKAQP